MKVKILFCLNITNSIQVLNFLLDIRWFSFTFGSQARIELSRMNQIYFLWNEEEIWLEEAALEVYWIFSVFLFQWFWGFQKFPGDIFSSQDVNEDFDGISIIEK